MLVVRQAAEGYAANDAPLHPRLHRFPPLRGSKMEGRGVEWVNRTFIGGLSMSHTRLVYHVVTATKDRAPLISPEVERILHRSFCNRALDQGGKVLRVGGVEDHVHIVVAIPATIAVADFVRVLKARSSRAIAEAGCIQSPFHWQNGYGAFTLNAFDLGTAIAYVANQKDHHARQTLWPPYEKVG